MAYTAKQERNGAVGSGGQQNSAQPGPEPVVPMGAAVAAGNAYGQEGHALMDALAGHTVSFDWEAGLAIGELPGEA
jgi:hypothetical protein